MYSLRTRMSHRIKRIIIFYRTQKIVSYRHRINIINMSLSREKRI